MNGDILDIYTDGACSGNPGPGGWGALLIYRGKKLELSGSEGDTTNNRMELLAAIEALESLKRPMRIRLYTDSTYVKLGITTWIQNWKINGWLSANKKPVKNKDLWARLDQIRQRHEIEWTWVRGHAGHPGNERADELARNALEKDLI